MTGMKQRVIAAVVKSYEWLESRLGLIKPISKAAAHPTPANNASWMYIFGSAATVLLVLQVVTGILLALVYSPSANEAWEACKCSTITSRSAGICARCMAGFGLHGRHRAHPHGAGVSIRAYKFPRELTWIVGVVLLLLTLGMAFTGQVMRFDQDAYWGLGIGASIASRVPWVGGPLVHLILGGPIIGAATLSRFFTLHVFVIPGILLAGVGVHIWMVLLHGVSDWPCPAAL